MSWRERELLAMWCCWRCTAGTTDSKPIPEHPWPSSCRSQPRIDRSILNIGMSQPILHKRQISAGVEQVRCNRMFQAAVLLIAVSAEQLQTCFRPAA